MQYILKLIFLICLFQSLRAQEIQVIPSKLLGQNDTVLVFKPKIAALHKALPVVYLLHGHGASRKFWSALVDLQHLADEYGFLIVCPDGLKKSWYIDSPSDKGWQYESFFVKELMPEISELYAVDRRRIFITGNSMGGYGAMWLFLRHPDLFMSAGSTSGVFDLHYSGNRNTTIAELLGPFSAKNKQFDTYSVINLLHNIQGTDKSIIFDSGTEDHLYIAAKKFRDKCDELKIKATYIAQPGGHTGRYWAKSILSHFRFFKNLAENSH